MLTYSRQELFAHHGNSSLAYGTQNEMDGECLGKKKKGGTSLNSTDTETATQTPVLQVRNVSKRFGGVKALNNVSLEVHRGEIKGLVGDNGAGKSTLIKIIAGVYPPDGGEVLINGEPVHFSSPRDARKYGIETVYQNLALSENLDVPSNFFLGRELVVGGLLKPLKLMRLGEMQKRARQAIEDLHVKIPAITSQVRWMSGGQRQAVAVARSAFWKGQLLLLDEPTAALGVEESGEVMRLLKNLATEQKISMIVISHNLEHVWSLCDSIDVLRQGKKVASVRKDETTPEEVVGFITGAHAVAGSK